MGKIRKTASPKHGATLSPYISKFIIDATTIPLYRIPFLLSSFSKTWPFPRGDLYHWIPLLNRFDTVFEIFNKEYGLTEGPQSQPFVRNLLLRGDGQGGAASEDELNALEFSSEGDRELVENIVSFTKILLENCGNRSLYASSGNLSDLLNTTSVSLVVVTLKLTLRLAQRYSAARLRTGVQHLPIISQTVLTQHYMVDLHKVEAIAQPFVNSSIGENNEELKPESERKSDFANSSQPLDFLSILGQDEANKPHEDTYRLRFSFYDPSSGVELQHPTSDPRVAVNTRNSVTTPTLFRPTSGLVPTTEEPPASLNTAGDTTNGVSRRPGFKVIELDPKTIMSTALPDLLKDVVPAVPKESRYELLNRIRVVHALLRSPSSRQDIVAARILAIANLAHIYPEQALQHKIFQQDSEQPRQSQIPYQLCDLVHAPGNGRTPIPKTIQSLALAALEAFTLHKHRSVEVFAALSANVNHGVLSYVVRKAVTETANESNDPDDLCDAEWRKTLFALLHALPKSNARTGEGLVSAGILEILAESLTIRTPKAEQNHPEVLNFLDVLIYNTRDAFNSLVNAKGLDATSELVVHEIHMALSLVRDGQEFPAEFKTQVTDYQIPFPHQQTLRAVFKFVHHMMSMNGGPFDRLLRNLIESSQFLGGLRTVITNPTVYGSNVWSGAVNIFSSFIHNEPTSYAAIAEAGLTKAFLETITQRPLPVSSPSSETTSENPDPSDAAIPEFGGGAKIDKGGKNFKVWTEQFARGVLPNAETITMIPQAFGAICLNESGMQQYEASQALRIFFKVFVSPLHVRALVNASGQEVEALGNAFDELARHHPRLRPDIVKTVSRMVAVIAHMSHTRAVKHYMGAKLWVRTEKGQVVVDGGRHSLESPANSFLGPPDAPQTAIQESTNLAKPDASGDIEMTDMQSSNIVNETNNTITVQEVTAMDHAPIIPSVSEYIGVFSRFLLGFLANHSLCTPFAETAGIERLLDIATSPSLPWDFLGQPSFYTLVRVIQVLVEHKPHLTLPSLVRRAHNAADQLTTFVEHSRNSSFFSVYLTPPSISGSGNDSGGNAEGSGTNSLKALLVIQTLCTILSKSLSVSNHRNASNSFSLVNLADLYASLVEKLGKLQSKCVWELVLLQRQIATWKDHFNDSETSNGNRPAPTIMTASNVTAEPQQSRSADIERPSRGATDAMLSDSDYVHTNLTTNAANVEHRNAIEHKNAPAIRHLVGHCPSAIATFFGALGKFIMQRRPPGDSYQKQNTSLVADHIARALVDVLSFSFPAGAETKSIDFYRLSSVTLTTQALVDRKADMDRPGPQILTLLIQSFKNKGGLTMLGDNAQILFERTLALSKDEAKSENPMHGGTGALDSLQKVLKLFSLLTKDKTVLEANQTIALTSRVDRDRDRPDFFSPHQFLVELRMEVLRAVLPIWNSERLDQTRASIAQGLTEIFQNVLEGQQEHGAYKRSDKIPSRNKAVHKVWKMRNPENMARLIDREYEADLAREALYRCNDVLNSAQEYCASYKHDPRLPRNPIPPNDDLSPLEPEANQSKCAPIRGPGGYPIDRPEVSVTATDPASAVDPTATLNQVLANLPASDLQPALEGSVAVDRQEIDLTTERLFDVPELRTADMPNVSREGENGTNANENVMLITIDDLDELRSTIRNTLMYRCLTVLNAFETLTFELADLIIAGVTKAPDPSAMREDISETLVQSLVSYHGSENLQEHSKKVAACAHLLGIILQEKDFFDAARGDLEDSFPSLLGFLTVPANQQADGTSAWMEYVLLIIERILAEDAQPQQIAWTPPSPDQPQTDEPVAHLPESLVSQGNKNVLFTQILELLPRIEKNAGLGLAVVRVLVNLTREWHLATQLGTRQNMQRLFVMAKQLSSGVGEAFNTAFMLILRHVVEDEETIRQIMRSDIGNAFEKPPRPMDTTVYTRSLYHLVLRQPRIFVEVTNEMLILPRFDRNQSPQTLALKKELSDEDTTEQMEKAPPDTASSKHKTDENVENITSGEAAGTTTLQSKVVEIKVPSVENPDGVIHFLLSELLSYKDAEETNPPLNKQNNEGMSNAPDIETTTNGRTPGQKVSNLDEDKLKTSDGGEFKAEDHPIHVYRCFIMKCLTELLASYYRTKVEFINFSRKADPQAATPSKPRSGVLNYLLHVLIPKGTLQHRDDVQAKMRNGTSNWAMNVVAALCSQTPEKRVQSRRQTLGPEAYPELLFVRKFVLEHALKAYKDANLSSESFDAKYSRMLSLADLFNRMLEGRPSHDNAYRRVHDHRDDSLVPTEGQMARIMFEKNFIAALTTSISDIDLNFPGSNRAVKYILRPLKLLTHTAIELSLASDIPTPPGQTDEDEISSATSISEAAENREETPDLFRNSTLGMFEPGREDESTSESSGEDDEDNPYGEDYADDMEYEEEVHVDDGDVVSEEDEDMEGVGPIEGLPGDIGMDVEIELDNEDEDSMDDAEEQSVDSNQDDEDEDGDIEVIEEITGDDENDSMVEGGEWEDEPGLPGGHGFPGSQSIVDQIQVPLPIADPATDGDDSQAALDMAADMVYAEGHLSATASQSENDMEAYPPTGMPLDGNDVEMEIDAEDPDEEDSEADDDDDEEEYHEQEVVYDGPDEDEDADMPPFLWGWPPTQGRRHTHHNRHNWTSLIQSEDRLLMPGYRSHRPSGAPGVNDDGTNPLLNRTRRDNVHPGLTGIPRGVAEVSSRPTARRTGLPEALVGGAWGRDLAGMDNNPVSYISNLINVLGHGRAGVPVIHHHHHPGGALHFSIGPPGSVDPLREMGELFEIGPPTNPPMRVQLRDDPFQIASFVNSTTIERWQQGARLTFGAAYTEKSQKVVNSILRLLVPPAMEAERVRLLIQLETAKQEEEDRVRQAAEQKAQEKKEQEEREAVEKATAEAEAQAQAESEPAAAHVEEDGPVDDKAETDGGAEAVAESEAMEGIETSETQPLPAPPAESAPSEPASRTFTNIRGRQLDITDLGIDIAYLEALPAELREEVIMQQYAEQRSQAAAAGEEPTAINREFLDALPADIREELVQQEAQDRRRRERDEARRRSAANGGPPAPRAEDMDPASFIASLDPILRQSVLAESDEDMLAQLPADIVAEARALGGALGPHLRRRAIDPTRARLLGEIPDFGLNGNPRNRLDFTQRMTAEGRPQRRPIVQMLDKSGIATLLRLMFVPVNGTARQSLNGILRNACGNHQTRGEVISGLLMILQDGSADLGAIERSFAQLTLRAKQVSAPKTPQSTKKSQPGQSVNGSEASPVMVVGQCLAALVFLTQSIAKIPEFFLKEHESVGGFKSKSKSSRKGKAKETKASRYPLNALLSLLDRKLVVDNSSAVEQLAGLLQMVTQPLSALLKKNQDQPAVANDQQVTSQEPPIAPQAGDAETSVAQTGPTLETTQAENAEVITTAPNEAGPSSNDLDANAPHAIKGLSIGEPKKSLAPPDIPEENLRLVVNILTSPDCNGKAFRDTLSTINNLSAIPGARGIFGQELVKRAGELGHIIRSDLLQLVKALLVAENEMEAQSLALASFSPTGSNQTKLNRVLTALDYLFDKKDTETGEVPENEPEKPPVEGEDFLADLYEDPFFSTLWQQLGDCLTASQQPDNYFLNVATILLPMIEALMVVCKRVTLKDSRSSKPMRRELTGGTPPPESGMRAVFFTFTNRHKKILNDLVRHNPKLMSGSFSVLFKNSGVMEFDNKRSFFNRRLHHRGHDTRHVPHPSLSLNVRRDQVFLDSYKSLYYKSANEIKFGKFNIRFHNEEGVDAGGVTREWFQVLARQMFNPDYALFNPVASDRTTFHPNALSSINQEHLSFFKFIGRIIGKALYENRVLDCHFSRAVYKRILGKAVSLKDMESLDMDYAKGMQWILDNDITDIITETFSIEQDHFGVDEIIDLIPAGRNVPVTEENKHEYVRLVIEYKLTGSVQEQLASFLTGFHDIVPAELISIFDEGELELLISGMPEVDVDDWKNNTEYHNYNATSSQVQWLWRAIRSFDKEERAKLLQFVTGTGKVPLNGFKELEGMNGYTRFSVHKDFGNKDRLPSSHTCFNQLDLPEYDSYESLRKNLYIAMTTGNEYFGYA